VLCGEEGTFKSDVWSLGVIFYRMLFGRLPWCGTPQSSCIPKLDIEFPNEIDIPYYFKQLLRNMLAHDPDRRISVDVVYDYLDS
jgi:serine/threonine protein kinase